MGPSVELAPSVVVHQGRGDFDGKKHPFDRPEPHKSADEHTRRLRADKGDCPPNADTRYSPPYYGYEYKKCGVKLEPGKEPGIMLTVSFSFCKDKEQPSAYCKVRNEHVDNCYDGD